MFNFGLNDYEVKLSRNLKRRYTAVIEFNNGALGLVRKDGTFYGDHKTFFNFALHCECISDMRMEGAFATLEHTAHHCPEKPIARVIEDNRILDVCWNCTTSTQRILRDDR